MEPQQGRHYPAGKRSVLYLDFCPPVWLRRFFLRRAWCWLRNRREFSSNRNLRLGVCYLANFTAIQSIQ